MKKQGQELNKQGAGTNQTRWGTKPGQGAGTNSQQGAGTKNKSELKNKCRNKNKVQELTTTRCRN
ncbi:hypothetical protein HYE39_03885 [Mycoplasmopsis bovis]|nr:hypothetical protein [Mycoplasmopsis bovis]QQH21189.1 hypothetical protein HYE39_03885 [Mycoplasmopsis bovis]